MSVTAEQVLDRIAELLVENFRTVMEDGFNLEEGSYKIEDVQKSVDGQTGQIVVGRPDGKKAVIYQYDKKANEQDLQSPGLIAILEADGIDGPLVDEERLAGASISFNTPFQGTPYNEDNTGGPVASDVILTMPDGSEYPVGDIMNIDQNNPINLSQFIDFEEELLTIDPEKAKEILDTDIFELVSPPPSNQQRINEFFAEWIALKGQMPSFDLDIDNDGTNDTWDNYIEDNQDDHSTSNDVVNNPMGSITRLDKHADTENSGKTLESLHRELGQYLSDVTKPLKGEAVDERPRYDNVSGGYLKIRHLNQGIVIRKQEGLDVGMETLYDVPIDELHPHSGKSNILSYLGKGFTIAMWVRFLDKTSRGTLFNYGNPFRGIDPKGFFLETYVLNKDDKPSNDGRTWGELGALTGDPTFFNNTNQERFVRLVVRDHLDIGDNNPDLLQGKLYDSHLGLPGSAARRDSNFVPQFGSSGTTDYTPGNENRLITNIRVPVDFNEWYFIVASYNPRIDDSIPEVLDYQEDPLYWLGNVSPTSNASTHRSGYGSKCKIEIISKSELLRARGYKT